MLKSLIHRSFKECPDWLREKIIDLDYKHIPGKPRRLNRFRRHIKFKSSFDVEETTENQNELMLDVTKFDQANLILNEILNEKENTDSIMNQYSDIQ